MVCLKYYVKLDQDGFPIPGTQMGYTKIQCGCHLALLSPVATVAPVGKTLCHHPKGIRFFYRVYRSGNIEPNSLFQSTKYPKMDKNNNTCILEYKKYC